MALLPYLDSVLVVLVAVLALALGAPSLGTTAGAAAWILVRLASRVADRRLDDVTEVRRRLALGVVAGMVRVWLLAGAIVAAGVGSSRADGLTAALMIFGAFSVFFAVSYIDHVSQKRKAGR